MTPPPGATPERRRGRPPASEARHTREALLEAALDLFATHGFAGTSVRRIARAAGLSEAGLYTHFGGKQDIYDVLFAQAGAVSLGALEYDTVTLEGLPPSQAVPQIVDRLLTLWESPRARAFTSVLLREGVPGAGPGGLAASAAEAQEALHPLFEEWLRRNYFRAGLTTPVLVWELFAPLFTLRFLYLHAGSGSHEHRTARELADRHVAFYLGAVLTDEEANEQANEETDEERETS